MTQRLTMKLIAVLTIRGMDMLCIETLYTIWIQVMHMICHIRMLHGKRMTGTFSNMLHCRMIV